MKLTEQQAIIDRNRKAATEQEKQIVSWHLSQQGVCLIDQMFFLNNDRARGALFMHGENITQKRIKRITGGYCRSIEATKHQVINLLTLIKQEQIWQ